MPAIAYSCVTNLGTLEPAKRLTNRRRRTAYLPIERATEDAPVGHEESNVVSRVTRKMRGH